MTKHWIDKFLDVWERTERTVDWRTARPFANDAICPYYHDIILKKVLASVEALKNAPQETLRKTFVSPTDARQAFVVIPSYCKLYKIPKKDRLEIFDFFYKIFKSNDMEDPLTYNWNNRAYSQNEIKNIIKKTKFEKVDKEKAREISKLSIMLKFLYEELYTDMSVNLGLDFNGPYKFGGKQLIIRDHFNLKPIEIWPHTKKYKYKTISLMTVHNAPVRFDYYGIPVYHKNKSLIETLYSFSLKIDGETINDIEQIKEIREYISGLFKEQAKIVKNLSFEKTKKWFVLVDALQYSRLFDAAGIDFDVKDIFKRIKGKQLTKSWGIWNNILPTEADRRFFRDIMDPRKEVYWKHPKWK